LIAVGFPASQQESRELGRCEVPRVFIQSTNDEFGPKPAMESYFSGLPEPKQLIWVEAKDHFFTGGLDDFEEAVLSTSPRGAFPAPPSGQPVG